MDEIQKTEARNYLTAGGLLLIGVIELLVLFHKIGGSGVQSATSSEVLVWAVAGSILLVLGILLLVIHKRDLAGITFIILGIANIMSTFIGVDAMGLMLITNIVCLLWGIIVFFSRDSQKWIFGTISILYGLYLVPLLFFAPAVQQVCQLVLIVIVAAIAFYFALAAGFERICLPGRRLITADETTDFKQSGSAVGYAIFGGVALTYALMYLNLSVFSANAASIDTAGLGFGFMLILIGILLFAVGQMKFTPVMFIVLGAAEMIPFFSSGIMLYAVAVLVIIAGLFAMLRKESRILPGIMLIVYGVTFFISAAVGGTSIAPIASFILNLIPALIAIYLAVATLSQRKIPLI